MRFKVFIISIFLIIICPHTNILANTASYTQISNDRSQEILQRPSIVNNDTGYFVDEYTQEPFSFLGGILIEFNLNFVNNTYCKYGIVDKDNNIICSKDCIRQTDIKTKFFIKDEGEYKFFISNYGASIIGLNKFVFSLSDVDTIISDAESLVKDESANEEDLICMINTLSETVDAISNTLDNK